MWWIQAAQRYRHRHSDREKTTTVCPGRQRDEMMMRRSRPRAARRLRNSSAIDKVCTTDSTIWLFLQYGLAPPPPAFFRGVSARIPQCHSAAQTRLRRSLPATHAPGCPSFSSATFILQCAPLSFRVVNSGGREYRSVL